MSKTAFRIALCVALSLAAATAPAAPRKPAAPLPERLPGCEPAEVRSRLSAPDSADVAKACGVIHLPWAYRGLRGADRSLRVYGRRHADSSWASRVSSLLLRDAVVDTAYRMRSTEFSCDSAANVPIYVVRLAHDGRGTVVVLRFDLGGALLFDSEWPLGWIALGDRGDSLWSALGEVLDDDPLLRGPRPEPGAVGAARGGMLTPGDTVRVTELPAAIHRVPPRYPDDARRNDVSGVVYVQALVWRDGMVHDAMVLSGPGALRDAALDAVWQWRFKPAMADSDAVAVWVMIPVKFTLR